jgi:hypothetical protein
MSPCPSAASLNLVYAFRNKLEGLFAITYHLDPLLAHLVIMSHAEEGLLQRKPKGWRRHW